MTEQSASTSAVEQGKEELAAWASQQDEPDKAAAAVARFVELVSLIKEDTDARWFRKRVDSWEGEGELTTEALHSFIRELEQRLAVA